MMRPTAKTAPTRRLIGLNVSPALDEHGFLDSDFAAELPTLDSIQNSEAVLVVAPPWTGKSHEAMQLFQHLQGDRDVLGVYIESTFFERAGLIAGVGPKWWAEWQELEEQRACWIVDALDEDKENRGMHAILDLIEELQPEVRERLSLLMFCRENEQPEDVKQRLVDIYGKNLQMMRLAPVCEPIARIITALDDDSFGDICGLILQNKLQAVASLPIVLKCLAKQEPDTTIIMSDLWRQVLLLILRDERRDARDPCMLSPIEDRFHAATRIAAALTFSDNSEVDAGSGQSSGPGIHTLFTTGMRRAERLSNAAFHVVKSTAFQRTATGYRFAQHHIQEWFTAFELRGVSLSRLRPLVSDSDGEPYPRFRGVLGMLHDLTTKEAVRNWIMESHCGVVPRSDAAPWSLEDAVW